MINKALVKTYKIIIPGFVRDKIKIMRNAGGLNTLRKNILSYYNAAPEKENDEIKMVINFLKKNPLKLFPYHFPGKYSPSSVKVYVDKERDLHYVLHEGKRMYFKRSWRPNDIRENYTNLLIEQDRNSPHRYLTENFTVGGNEVVADIGAAEGIFSLSVIETAKKIYLFETDKEWIEALQATFIPWNDKTEIINKFVSDKNDEGNISLDKFSACKNVLFDFIKIDVDGAELPLLNGAAKFYRQHILLILLSALTIRLKMKYLFVIFLKIMVFQHALQPAI